METDWDGKNRRKATLSMHQEPLAECIERYKAICDKLDALVIRFDRINGRYDAHLVESVSYRAAVDAHNKRFDTMENQTRWIIGVLISTTLTIIIQISTFAYLWGQLTKRVEINTDRLSQIEVLHPRLNTIYEENKTRQGL